MGLQWMCVGLAGLIAAMIVAAGWWSGNHCPRCGAAGYTRSALPRKTAGEAGTRRMKTRIA
jgi:hypothetical protein